jgi:hypothetical protein
MNSNESLEQLYKLIRSKHGKKEARSTVKAILGNIIDDLENEGIEVSANHIASGLQKYLEDFQEASNQDVA